MSSTNGAIHSAGRSFLVETLISSLILVIGIVLLIYMISVESEPGALPLLLVVVGLGWLVATRIRARARHRAV